MSIFFLNWHGILSESHAVYNNNNMKDELTDVIRYSYKCHKNIQLIYTGTGQTLYKNYLAIVYGGRVSGLPDNNIERLMVHCQLLSCHYTRHDHI